jgi:hypothetical protein
MLYCYYESGLVKFYHFITKPIKNFFLKSSFLHLIVLPHILFFRSNFSKLSFITGILVIFHNFGLAYNLIVGLFKIVSLVGHIFLLKYHNLQKAVEIVFDNLFLKYHNNLYFFIF